MGRNKLGSYNPAIGASDDAIGVESLYGKVNAIKDTVGLYTDDHDQKTIYGKVKLLEEDNHATTVCYPFQKDPIQLTAGATAWVGDGTIVSLTNNETACDADVAVNVGGGIVQIPANGHHVKKGYYITIPTSDGYTGNYLVDAVGANTINIVATYAAETFEAADKVTDVIPDDFAIHRISINSLSANGSYEVVLFSGASGSEVEIARTSATRNAVQSQEGTAAINTPLLEGKTRVSARLLSSNAAADTCVVKVEYNTYA